MREYAAAHSRECWALILAYENQAANLTKAAPERPRVRDVDVVIVYVQSTHRRRRRARELATSKSERERGGQGGAGTLLHRCARTFNVYSRFRRSAPVMRCNLKPRAPRLSRRLLSLRYGPRIFSSFCLIRLRLIRRDCAEAVGLAIVFCTSSALFGWKIL